MTQLNQEQINSIIASLSLKDKLSQMFIVGYDSYEPDKQLLEWAKSYLGGIILFRANIESPLSVANIIHRIQSDSKIPLFVSIDQEGGLVERVNGMTQVPSFMGLSSINDENAVFSANEILARELSLIGFNLNFTPVVDVNTEPKNPVIGIRSFGDNPQVVTKNALKVLEAHRKYKVIPTAKHFPGHGASSIDSHLALPLINLSDDDFKNIHLRPFVELIKDNVEMIMVCHAFFENYSEAKDLPASLSKKIIQELLINKLNYQGVVITDDLQMNAITDMYTVEKAAEKAIDAGVDILLYRNYKEALLAYNYLLSKLETGTLFVDRIDYSLAKILRLKSNYGLLSYKNTLDTNMITQEVFSSEHQHKANDLFDKSISIYKQPEDFRCVDKISSRHIFYVDRSQLYHYNSETEFDFNLLIPDTGATKFSLSPSDEEIKDIVSKAKEYDLLIIISYNAIFNQGQENLIKQLTKLKNTYVMVAGNPFDVFLFSDAQLIALTYGFRNASIRAFVKLLNKIITGNINSPVNLPL